MDSGSSPFAAFTSLRSLIRNTTMKDMNASPRNLHRRAGRPLDRRMTLTEELERRVMMAGDHPSLSQFPSSTNIALNGQGIGQVAGVIEPLGAGITEQNDLFRFTATATDFVTLYADAQASGSTLNTRLQVYEDSGTGTAVQARDAFGQLIASSSGNGTTSFGTPTDGWIGFVAQSGKTYYVLVGTDVTSGSGSSGNYTIRVDAQTTTLAVETTADSPDLGVATTPDPVTLARVGQDIVFKVTAGSDAAFDSITTFNSQADRGDNPNLDVRLDIYNDRGVFVAGDSDSGLLNDGFRTLKTLPGQTYFVRVRSDEFLDTRAAFATGGFTVGIDMAVNKIPVPIDPVTRRSAVVDQRMSAGLHTMTFEWTAQGTGKSIVAATASFNIFPPNPLFDSAIRIFDTAGNQLAFNDDRFGITPQIEIDLTGGTRYYALIDAFNESPFPGTDFNFFIESHHNWNDDQNTGDDAGIDSSVDDHVNTPAIDQEQLGDPAYLGQLRERFRRATPLAWNSPYLVRDQYGWYMQDTGWRTDAVGTGRIHNELFSSIAQDNDLFSFVPQVDMLTQLEGDNGDDGPSLFAGGVFTEAGRITDDIANTVNHVATYDANDWWGVGRGFNNNVRAFVRFDDDGDGVESLFAGGEFTEVVNGEGEDPIVVNRIAKLVFNDLLVRWEWAPVGDPQNPGVAFNVFAMTPFSTDPGNVPPVLAIGGNGLSIYDGVAITTVSAVTGGSIFSLASAALDWPDPTGNFETPVYFTSGVGPSAVATGDFNLDNWVDIAVTNSTAGTVSIFRNNQNGNPLFLGKVDVGVGSLPSALVVADLDGDLDLDIAVANNGSDNVTFLRNNGSGTFASAGTFTAGDGPSGIAAGDIDNDGDIDLVVSNFNSDNVSILLNNGNGTFGAPTNIAFGDGPSSILLATLDNNTSLDLAVTNFNADTFSTRYNNGTGTFGNITNFTTGDGPTAIAGGQLDADADIDLVVANFNSSTVSRFNNNGTTFAAKVDTNVATNPTSLTVNNFDSQARPDVAVTSSGANIVTVLYNNGTGNLTRSENISLQANSQSAGIASADLDNDNDIDLTVANRGTNRMAVIRNNPDATGENPEPAGVLAIGGSFTSLGSNAGAFLALWDGGVGTLPGNYPPGTGTTFDAEWLTIPTNGTVFSLLPYDAAAIPDGGPDFAQGFLVGGAFTTLTGQTVNRLGYFTLDANDDGSTTFAGFGVGGGTNNIVRSLSLWDPPDPDGNGPAPDLTEQIIVGGDFTNRGGRIARYDWLNQEWAALGDPTAGAIGFDARVNSLVVMTDSDDQGAPEGVPTVYAGGAFSRADVDGFSGVDLQNATDPYAANHVAKLVFDPFIGDWCWKSAGNARDNGVNAEVFALQEFNDANASIWDHHQRPATLLNVTVVPTFGPSFNAVINVYDSNFNLIYTNANLDATIWSSQFPDGSTFPFDTGRAGMIDPSLAFANPQLDQSITGIPVWGGRTYYIEVSAEPAFTPNGYGRYELRVTAEAFVPDGPNNAASDPVDETQPQSGGQIALPPGTGDTNDYLPAPNQAREGRSFFYRGYAALSDYGNIHNVDDTDVYFFRAQAGGFADIRVNTTNINDDHNALNVRTREVFSTDLDSYIRVLDGDFNQIGFNDDNPFVTGEPGSAQNAGAQTSRVFSKRDARVTFPIIEGNFYYVIVGSGQKWADASPEDPANRVATDDREINWRVATGGYELVVNTMQDLDPATDDHSDIPQLETPMSIAFDPSDAANNGKGSADGIVNNALDVDGFMFISPTRGPSTLRLDRASASTVVARVQLFDSQGNLLGDATMGTAGIASLTFTVQPGVQYFAYVTSESNSTGGYRISVSLPPYADDFADVLDWTAASDFPIFDYLGGGTVNGRLESAGDSDVFRFVPDDFGVYTVSVANLSPTTLDPQVEIYEVHTAFDDPSSPAMWQRIAWSEDISAANNGSSVSFSVTPDRVSVLTGLEYKYYYIVVTGENAATNFGSYSVTVSFPPTDDFPDAGEFDLADVIQLDPETGGAVRDGTIELAGDSDLFTFTALAGGDASIIVKRRDASLIVPKVTIIRLTPGEEILASGTAIDDPFGFIPADSGIFRVTRDAQYYILVEATTDVLGEYEITISSPPIDDYPNIEEWEIASVIGIDPTTGDGFVGVGIPGDGGNARLTPIGDTDLFVFTPARSGQVVITITSYRGTFGNFAPDLKIYDNNLNLIGSADADSPAGINDPRVVEITFSSLNSGQNYFVLVSAVQGLLPPATTTGEYYLFVNGEAFSDGGGDPGAIDFSDPTTITLDSRTGDGARNDFIDEPGDRDLFTFFAPATGRIFVQVVTPTGSILDAAVTILSAANENSVIVTDSSGIPGATANVSFNGTKNAQYWAIVTGLAAGVGSYRIRVDAEPEVFTLFYPEGYSSLLIREFVSVANNNNYDVRYTVKLRYEDGPGFENQPSETVVISNALVQAGSRSGVTISNAELGPAAGVQLFRPYAILIESDGPLGATVSRYDFGATAGDAFSETLSERWSFARIERNPGAIFDFIVYYNPNDFDVAVTVTFYPQGSTPVTVTQTVGANKRLGLNVNDIVSLPTGVFGANVIAAPVNSANDGAFIGITAALSHFDVAGSAGFGYLGDSAGGSTKGALPSLENGTSVSGELFLFNPGTSRATVTITGKYVTANLPDLVRSFDINAGAVLRFDGASLGVTPNQPIGISYTSSVPIVMTSNQTQNGDADATGGFTTAATRYFFGDAFINTALAGSLYFETLSFYNPTNLPFNIAVTLLFTDSDTLTVNVPVNPLGYGQLKLHELPQLIIDRPGLNFFSVRAEGPAPFVATMNHYDLFLAGGWTTRGVPLGLQTDLASIS
jgi:FG-GAP-like repeat